MPTPFESVKFNRQHVDRTFWVIFLILVGVSVLALFSSSSTLIHKATAQGHNPIYPIAMQILYVGIGVGIAWVLQFLPSWVYRLFGYVLLGLGMLFLLLNAAHIGVTINGATRWVRIAGITIQSSELAKVGLIIVVTHLLSQIKDSESERRNFLWALGLTVVTCLLIMIGNLSTAILLGAVIILLMILARIPWKWWTGIIVAAALFLVIGYLFVEYAYVRPEREMKGPLSRAQTWVNRIDRKLEEHSEEGDAYKITDDNYQAMLARVAVAMGGKSPIGVLPGNSLERDHLPLANADYIFAIIVEETGFVGALLLCFLYLSVLFRCCYASSRYNDYAAQLMMMGLGLMLTLQALVSMAVAVGLGPVTGQPLPLISKGGTSAIITSIYFGMMMGVSREQNQKKAQQEQTIEESMQEVPELNTD